MTSEDEKFRSKIYISSKLSIYTLWQGTQSWGSGSGDGGENYQNTLNKILKEPTKNNKIKILFSMLIFA